MKLALVSLAALESPAALPLVTRGIALRYWNEAYPDPEAVAELDRNSSLDRSVGFQTAIEDYGVKP